MIRNMKIITAAMVLVGVGVLAQPTLAQNKGGRSIGVGTNVRHSKPSMPSGGGNYGRNNNNYRPNQSPFVYGGFVPPSVIVQPSFVAPNYYLPGDYYAQSSFFYNPYYSPAVVYPAPLSGGGFIFSPPSGGGPNRHNLTFGPLNR